MLYMSEFFQEKLRLPVAYLNTFGAVAIDSGVDREKLQTMAPMSQELIGSALQSVTRCPINISLLPRSIRKQYELNAKKPYFYASAAVLLACLFLFGVGVAKLLDREEGRRDRAGKVVAGVERVSKEIKSLNGECNAAKDRYESFKRVFSSRANNFEGGYFRILAELQRIMPDQMWLVSLEPSDVCPPEPKKKLSGGSEDNSGGEVAQGDFDSVANFLRDQREIKFLIIKGYTISTKNTLSPVKGAETDYLRRFFENVKNSKVFKENYRLYTNERTGNLTGFYVILELNEIIRK